MRKQPSVLIREVQKRDVNGLLELANTPGMFNFPANPEAMKDRIETSMRSFTGKEKDLKKTKYVFVAEDLETGQILATSMIAGQHGTEASPHYFFKVGTEKRFSPAIQTGFIHGTLTLKVQTDGPSELGALVVNRDFRNHPEKVGRQIFFSRFLYLATHRDRFKEQILAELLPPLNKKGHSPLWEAIGRRFTSLDYWEADALSAQNKEFIFDLFPQGKIYTTFLPADARSAIGKVSKDTEPVQHLLKRIGFAYQNEIDPFDGGPHLRVKVSEIGPLKRMATVQLSRDQYDQSKEVSGLIMSTRSKEGFAAVNVTGTLIADTLHLSPQFDMMLARKLLEIEPKEPVVFLPYF